LFDSQKVRVGERVAPSFFPIHTTLPTFLFVGFFGSKRRGKRFLPAARAEALPVPSKLMTLAALAVHFILQVNQVKGLFEVRRDKAGFSFPFSSVTTR
jgi:hypothetical protein